MDKPIKHGVLFKKTPYVQWAGQSPLKLHMVETPMKTIPGRAECGAMGYRWWWWDEPRWTVIKRTSTVSGKMEDTILSIIYIYIYTYIYIYYQRKLESNSSKVPKKDPWSDWEANLALFNNSPWTSHSYGWFSQRPKPTFLRDFPGWMRPCYRLWGRPWRIRAFSIHFCQRQPVRESGAFEGCLLLDLVEIVELFN